MEIKLHYNTTTPLLLGILRKLMEMDEFDIFRLVGGTALSLYRGHRLSADIDLFTASSYGTVNFSKLENYLRTCFRYVDSSGLMPAGIGKSYFVGTDKDNCIKLDLYYTDEFIRDPQIIDDIRLASVEDILAMKVDVIGRGGRKKDFWDIHELMEDYSLDEMLSLHEKRYPYSHDPALLLDRFNDFSQADDDFDPVCLKGKHWELIKLDLIELVGQQKAGLTGRQC